MRHNSTSETLVGFRAGVPLPSAAAANIVVNGVIAEVDWTTSDDEVTRGGHAQNDATTNSAQPSESQNLHGGAHGADGVPTSANEENPAVKP